MSGRALKIYLAGDLFDAKDIAGNLLLAGLIEKKSGGRYQVMLPQDGESEVTNRTSQSIRDADFELLLNCDVIVANFDGTDLDSGTVVEFCFAKMLDMPAVLLRTDFRNSGDATLPDGEPWNLMCSHYPRTEVRHINAMLRYHEYKDSAVDKIRVLENFYEAIAEETVQAIDKVVACESWLKENEIQLQLKMLLKSVGKSLSERFPEERIKKLAESKSATTLYRASWKTSLEQENI